MQSPPARSPPRRQSASDVSPPRRHSSPRRQSPPRWQLSYARTPLSESSPAPLSISSPPARPVVAPWHPPPHLGSIRSPSPANAAESVWSGGVRSSAPSAGGRSNSTLHQRPKHMQQHMEDTRRRVARNRLVDAHLREHCARHRSPSPGGLIHPPKDILREVEEEMHLRACRVALEKAGKAAPPTTKILRPNARAQTPPPPSTRSWGSPVRSGSQRSLRSVLKGADMRGFRRNSLHQAVRKEADAGVDGEAAVAAVQQWRCSLRCLASAADGAVVWGGGNEGGISGLSTNFGEPICALDTAPQDASVYANCIHAGVDFVWVGLSSGHVHGYSLPSGELGLRAAVHTAAVVYIAPDPSEGGQRMHSVGADGSVAVFRAGKHPILEASRSGCVADVRCAAFVSGTLQPALIWVGTKVGTLFGIAPASLAKGEVLSGSPVPPAKGEVLCGARLHQGTVTALASDHSGAFSAGADGTLLLVRTGQGSGGVAVGCRRSLGQGAVVTALCCDTEALRLWVGDSTGTISVWGTEELKPMYALPQRLGTPVCSLAVKHWRRADALRLWALGPQSALAWLVARDTDGTGAEDAVAAMGQGSTVTNLSGAAESILGPHPNAAHITIERHRTGGRIGVRFGSGTLIVCEVVPESPAGRTELEEFIGWRLTHIDDRRVMTFAEAKDVSRVAPAAVRLRLHPPPPGWPTPSHTDRECL
eukprot:Hpha_TRINITY_DN19820_c0_g1::TRINITY_DN19820_c0_g1_i1::g.132034::m.132034